MATPKSAEAAIKDPTSFVATIRLALNPKRDDICNPIRIAVTASTIAAPDSVAMVASTWLTRATR